MSDRPAAELPLKIPSRTEARRVTAPNRRENEGLIDLVPEAQGGLAGVFGGGQYNIAQNSQPWTLAYSNQYTPITLNRILLSYSYMTQGLVQTVIGQPVDDAFRGGVEIETDELDEDEVKELQMALLQRRVRPNETMLDELARVSGFDRETSDLEAVMETCNWARLYGGAGLMINCDQDPSKELDVEAINDQTPLEFIACDRWELILTATNIWDTTRPTPFNYYGTPVHFTRVSKLMGVKAPSYIRQRLQGWGMSELERCIRAINAFVKFENAVFELIDEAKIDVYKIEGFNASLATAQGTTATQTRIALSNAIKNFQRALVMDMGDDYEQKTMTYEGIADLWHQFRLNLCSALKMPYNKLFGEGETGFGSGEDSMENYNTMVMSVRDRAESPMRFVIDCRCQQLFGFVPKYTLKWRPLRELSGLEEEQVQTEKQNRALALFDRDLLDGQETMESMKKDGLLNVESAVLNGEREAMPMDKMAMEQEGEQFERGLKSTEKLAGAKMKADERKAKMQAKAAARKKP